MKHRVLASWGGMLGYLGMVAIAVAPASAQTDCNNDGIPDAQQLAGTYQESESQMFDVTCNLSNARSFVSSGFPPDATSAVTLTIDGLGLNVDAPDEWLDVIANGLTIGRFYERPQTCDTLDIMTLSPGEWNNVVALDPNGRVEIELVRSAASCAGERSCGGFFALYTLSVDYDFDADLNDNGWLDECIPDCDPSGPDADADGVSDGCDQCPGTIAGHPYVDEWGCPLFASAADLDLDGDVDQLDQTGFFTCDGGPEVAVAPGCDAFDYLADGDIDLHDYLSLQDAASPTDTLAELASAGAVVPHFLLVDAYVGGAGSQIDWDEANTFCATHYGTRLASINSGLPIAEQIDRRNEMIAIAGALGASADAWFGLRFDINAIQYRWADGSLLMDGAVADWAFDDATNIDEFIGGSVRYCLYLWSADNHRWNNTLCDAGGGIGTNIQAWLCDSPIIVDGSEDGLTAAALNVQVASAGNNNITVEEGTPIAYEVRGQLSNASNEGLAGFAFDLSFDGGALNATNAPSVGPLTNFAAPLGYNNPSGFGGTVIDGNLVQVGGGQNTINNGAIPGPTGSVATGFGHTEVVLATGTLVAPSTPGTYTLSISNVTGTTINQGETGVGVWRCEPTDAGTATALTITVQCSDADVDGVCDVDDLCPGFDDNVDTDGDGLADGCDACPNDASNDSDGDGVCDSVDLCPGFDDSSDVDADGTPDNCDTERLLVFDAAAPGSYTSYTENGSALTGSALTIANDPNSGFTGQYFQSTDSFVLESTDEQPFDLVAFKVRDAALAGEGFSSWRMTAEHPDGSLEQVILNIFGDPAVIVALYPGDLNNVIRIEFQSLEPLSVLQIDNMAIRPNCPGDRNDDATVDLTDLSIVLGDFGRAGSDLPGDVDADGDVDLADLATILSLFGQSCD